MLRVLDELLDAECFLGGTRPFGVESGEVETKAIFEDGCAGVPAIGAAWVGRGRAETHVGHGDLVDVVGRVLGDGKTTGGRGFASKDIEYGLTTALTRVSSPKNGVHLCETVRVHVRNFGDTGFQGT